MRAIHNGQKVNAPAPAQSRLPRTVAGRITVSGARASGLAGEGVVVAWGPGTVSPAFPRWRASAVGLGFAIFLVLLSAYFVVRRAVLKSVANNEHRPRDGARITPKGHPRAAGAES